MKFIFTMVSLSFSSMLLADLNGTLTCDDGGKLTLQVNGQRIEARSSTQTTLAYAEVGDGEMSGLMYGADNSSLGEFKIKPDNSSVILKFSDGKVVRCRK